MNAPSDLLPCRQCGGILRPAGRSMGNYGGGRSAPHRRNDCHAAFTFLPSFDYLGSAFDKTLVTHSVKRLGVVVKHGVINPESANGFNYLLTDNEFEHVNDPAGFWGDVLGLLAQNGIALVAVPPVAWVGELLATVSTIPQRSCSAQLNLCYDSEQCINYFSRSAMQTLVEWRLHQVLTPNRFLQSKFPNGPLARMSWFETGYDFITRTSQPA